MRVWNRQISRRMWVVSSCMTGLVVTVVVMAFTWESRPIAQIVNSLKLAPGQRVADLGAGDGAFTFQMAEAVGGSGLVYAIEIEQKKLDRIEKKARERKLSNVRTALAAVDDPRLPEPMDLILIVNTLHHINGRADYLRNLRRYLKPEGRVAIIDFSRRWPPFHGKMKYSVGELDGWMQAAGFQRLEQHDYLPRNFFVIYGSTTH